MAEFEYQVLDVFTDTALAGNPLAIVFGARQLDTQMMQRIAREFNLSETVFVLPPENKAHRARIRIFTPDYELPFAGHPTVGSAVALAALDGGYTVELSRSGKSLQVPGGKTILQVLREAGVEVAHSCEEGVCGACETRVLSGIPDHRDAILSDPEKAANNTMMICCSGCKGERLVLDL